VKEWSVVNKDMNTDNGEEQDTTDQEVRVIFRKDDAKLGEVGIERRYVLPDQGPGEVVHDMKR
jgi:hypothetical protein